MDEIEHVKQKIQEEKKDATILKFNRVILDAMCTALTSDTDFEEEKIKIRALKEKSIENLDELVIEAKKNLERMNCKVYLTKSKEEALEIALKELEGISIVCKSKSNDIKEIGLIESLQEKGVEVIETDLGDRIIQLTGEKPGHPIGPAGHVPVAEVAKAMSKEVGVEVENTPEDIVAKSRLKLREKILSAGVGLTGANAISAKEGAIILLANEGNISLITRLPRKHVCIAGITKIAPEIYSALSVPLTSERAIFGPSKAAAYISIIRGPSRTADVQFLEVIGMHGAQEVVIILLDNWRSRIKNIPEIKEFLYCISCGACLPPCTALLSAGMAYGSKYAMGVYGVIKSALLDGVEAAVKNGLFLCTGCGACKAMCPLKIDLPRIIRYFKEVATKKGLAPPKIKEISKNILETGSPFAEEKKIK